ncbi:hypothetical protein EJB05_28618 [Eragrostis curvula]|uniref:Uncharacterized protein n=1 Tax=Eragrostis curvula TaxID=38414 RepID=A0A5J9UQE8_9POAL|nr:hypothetical protein EJB05_28618 [Eragrostis curvula]
MHARSDLDLGIAKREKWSHLREVVSSGSHSPMWEAMHSRYRAIMTNADGYKQSLPSYLYMPGIRKAARSMLFKPLPGTNKATGSQYIS